MRRLFAAVAVLVACAAGAQAGSPESVRLVERMKAYSTTHFVRGSQGKAVGGGTSSATAEARSAAPETPKAAKSANPKPTPQPAKAD